MKSFGKSAICGIGLFALCNCQSISKTDAGTVYHGFTQINPEAQQVIENAWLVVDGHNIIKTGNGDRPNGNFVRFVDMTGYFALPGMVDGHAHITAGPYEVDMSEELPRLVMESDDDITQYSARTALAFGITTVRNPGGSTLANAEYDKNIASGLWVGPEAFHAGAVIQPPPMGGNSFKYPKSNKEWAEEAKFQADNGMKYFKLYVDLNEDEIEKGIQAAHNEGLKTIGHLNGVSWTKAAKLGIDGLEHALPTSPDLLEPEAREQYLSELGPDSKFMYRWFELVDFEGPLFQEMIATLAEHKTELNFNFVVNDLVYNANSPNAHPIEWDKFIHPTMKAAADAQRAGSMRGWTDEDYQRASKVFPRVLEFGKRLYDAKLPIMVGTDTNGGTPYFAREMAFHVEAGIPVWEVLRMATSSATEILGIDNRTGTITVGKEADIVFLRSNPLDDISNVVDVELTVSNGIAYTHESLMQANIEATEILIEKLDQTELK